jgi:hypothetical protein
VLATGGLVDEISVLKAQPGQDIIAYGGATFVASLIQRGLIDEYYLFVNPAEIGHGLAIFSELGGKQELTLVDVIPFACGIVVLHYALRRIDVQGLPRRMSAGRNPGFLSPTTLASGKLSTARRPCGAQDRQLAAPDPASTVCDFPDRSQQKSPQEFLRAL